MTESRYSCHLRASSRAMYWLFVLSLLLACTHQLPNDSPSALEVRSHSLSPYSAPLKRRYRTSPRHGSRARQRPATLIDSIQQRFLIPIKFGGGPILDAEVDTGSSDTWLIQTGFSCYNSRTFSPNSLVKSSACNFGGTYTPDVAFTPLKGLHLSACYGNGARCIRGPMGTAPVTIAGLLVPSQAVGAPNQVSHCHLCQELFRISDSDVHIMTVVLRSCRSS